MQLWLLEAAYNDTSTMLTQMHEFKSFLTQQTSSSGRGPCSLTHERSDIATQIHAAKVYTTEFNNTNACSAALQENANPQVFVSSSSTRHRPVKIKTGIEGTFVQKKEQMKSSVKKNIHIGLGHKINEAEAILAEKEIDFSPPCSQVVPQENFLEVVLMATLGIRGCHGCNGPILKQNCLPPKIWCSGCKLFNYGEQRDKKNGKNATEISIFT